MVRPMVHSTKHYVQTSIATITGGGLLNTTLVDSVSVSDKNTPNEVEEGNSVKAIYCEYWLRAGSTTPSSFVAAVYKVPGGGAAFSVAEMAGLGLVDNKKNILFTSQGLVNDQDSTALNLYRGWIKIPKSKQRMGLGDRMILTVSAIAVDIQICGLTIYKEYS